ncbi:hypothetical protein N7U66_20485 [Lacinutrix neustonica]|uniref:Uncharacterized protein n=1 Tax=Lacinutrix neustonica TaxID=2980107 RepID=A0A9E8SDH9_9FLAO|nr:hypothetical protein [Lacinutrix neustonica]WAC02121.1 hypothetical protein N7U66_20485 [Lacinutrix neustonica]
MKNHLKTVPVIIDFLNGINIKVIEKKLPNDTFLPGLAISGNSILIDLKQLKYPGDLLHEAGHIAVTEEKVRPFLGTEKMGAHWPTDGDEIAAILRSYAASSYLNLDLTVVFHQDGYKNESEWLIEQFKNGNYMGLPLLEWMSLCRKETFPVMEKWLR